MTQTCTTQNTRTSASTTLMTSTYRKVWHYEAMPFPEFSGLRIMMMPVVLGDLRGVPEQYRDFVKTLYGMVENRFIGCIGYLTIDERIVKAGNTLRRSGLHVDGYYKGTCGAWGGGGRPGGTWGSVGNGMMTVSSTPHCKAYLGRFEDQPGSEGECDHIPVQEQHSEIFEAGAVYWVDGACIHESLPVDEDTPRQFVRLSMPSNGPWFEGYTENPEGVLPSNEILPRRDQFMTGDVE